MPSSMRPRLEQLTLDCVRFFADMNLPRIEYCLYFSVILATAIALHSVVTTFTGYTRIFVECQSGNYDFQGHVGFKDYLHRPDSATFFPGMLFSTCLLMFVIWFLVIFVILSLGTSFHFMINVVGKWCGAFAIGIFCNWIIQLVVLRRLLMSWFCMQDGEIVRPRFFAALQVILSISNFALGITGAFARLIILPFMLFRFGRLDVTLVEEKRKNLDPGFKAFLTTVALTYEKLNPIRRTFIGELMTTASHLYGPKPECERNPDTHSAHCRRLLVRNRWWLAAIMSQNPGLKKYRCGAGAEP